jgi:molybdopterin molybdotransferase
MITVDEALARLLALVRPVPTERVGLREAAGRVLRAAAIATRDQPPFDASAMDGYALAGDPAPGARFRVVGAARAGAGYPGRVGPGEAVRIFTGAPVPEGATRVVIQEDVDPDGDAIVLRGNADAARHIRGRGCDFRAGADLGAPRRLRAVDLGLLAAMNLPAVEVARRPEIALIATGDELVMPGEVPAPDQIIASNAFAIAALAEAEGARVRLLPVAPDDPQALGDILGLARGVDVVVTIGGASVGAHDLVAATAEALGLERSFWKIAMRPGKPLMAGRFADGRAMLGLPGNPVSSIVCSVLFLLPMLRAMQGLPDPAAPVRRAILAGALGPNGPRAHYMRARLLPDGPDGRVRIAAFDEQDSARQRLLTEADALLIRPAGAAAAAEGAEVGYIAL